MPYFVFNVKPFARKETPGRSQVSLTPSGGLTRSGRFGGTQIEKLAEFAAFREASAHAKALRLAQDGAAGRIKVMFADNQQLAEDLLCQIRGPGPSGDE